MSPARLTLANRVTLLRILAIPFFVLTVLYYAAGYRRGEPRDILRVISVLIFVGTALTDALDGYLARSRGERTVLGSFLDPIADKTLLVSTLVLLSCDLGGAFHRLPLWFTVLVISRDLVLVAGIVLIHLIDGPVPIRPSLTGKAATFFQMVALAWILVRLDPGPLRWLVGTAGFFTLASGFQYVLRGSRLLATAGRGTIA